MTEMPAEIPVDLEVGYVMNGDELNVTVAYGKAVVTVSLDWAEEGADPGSDFNFLHAVLPTAVARVHQQIQEGTSA